MLVIIVLVVIVINSTSSNINDDDDLRFLKECNYDAACNEDGTVHCC